jgi:tetratricopeptide (TPR) repeat protein
MAEQIFRGLSKSGATQEIRNKGELGLINVLKVRAENEPDPDAKKKLFDEAIQKYKGFLKGKTDPQALFNLAELLKSKGVDFTREIKLAEDEETKKDLVKEAHDAFEEAVNLVKDFLDKITSQMGEMGIEDLKPDEFDQLRNAMFNHADLHYLMAQVFSGAQDKKVEILNKSVILFEEFIWEFEDFGQAYLAYVQMGRCYVEMGEYGKALDQYRNVLAVPEPRDPNTGRIVSTPQQRLMRDRLRIMAYYRILEALVLAKKFEDAVEKAAEMQQEYPNCIEAGSADPLSGRAAILEKAKALAGMGKVSEAISEAVDVVDKGGWFMQVGMKLLGDWVAQDPKAGVRIILLQAEGLFRTQKFNRAILAYQNAIDKIDTKEKMKDFGAQAWADMAGVYAARELYYEAGLSFVEGERVAQIFIQGVSRSTLREESLRQLWDKAAECSYMAYRAFKLAWESTKKGKVGSEYLKEQYSEQRKKLTNSYADSVYAKNLQFFAGQDNLRQEKFLDAVTSFQAVDPASSFYETSLVGIGQAYFKEFARRKEEEDKKYKALPVEQRPAKLKLNSSITVNLERSEKSFQKYLKLAETKAVEGEDSVARRKTLFGYTYFFMARIHTEREQWKKVLEVLEEFEDNFKEKPDLVLTAVFLKMRAFYNLKKARSVEDMLRVMEDVDEVLRAKSRRKKKHQYLIIGYQLAGAIYGELAIEAKKQHERETYQEYNEKAAEYLWTWLENDILADIGAGDPSEAIGRLDAVGIKMFKAKEFEKAARIYDTILRKQELSSKLSEDQTLRFKRKIGDCYIELGQWENALTIFTEVYEKKKLAMFLEKLVLIYTRLGDTYSEAGDAQKANVNYDEALKLYNVVLGKDEPEKIQWWEWKLAVWSIMFKKGNYKRVTKQITNAELLYPRMGGPKVKDRIKKLLDNAKELAGSRRKR